MHAIEDYMTSTALPYTARKLGVTPNTRRIMDSVAAVAGAQSMITDYEGGVLRLLPMRAHLAADVLMGVGLISIAGMMRRKPTVDRLALLGLGAFSIVTALMTRGTPDDRDGE